MSQAAGSCIFIDEHAAVVNMRHCFADGHRPAVEWRDYRRPWEYQRLEFREDALPQLRVALAADVDLKATVAPLLKGWIQVDPDEARSRPYKLAPDEERAAIEDPHLNKCDGMPDEAGEQGLAT